MIEKILDLNEYDEDFVNLIKNLLVMIVKEKNNSVLQNLFTVEGHFDYIIIGTVYSLCKYFKEHNDLDGTLER